MLVSLATFGQREIILKSDVAGKTAAQALGDTVTNTATKTQSSTAIIQAWKAVGVAVTVTKISGTVAGVVRLHGSADGVNYTRIAPTDSLIALNVTTNYKLFNPVTAGGVWPWKYVRVTYTGVGTMSAGMTSKAILK